MRRPDAVTRASPGRTIPSTEVKLPLKSTEPSAATCEKDMFGKRNYENNRNCPDADAYRMCDTAYSPR